MADWEGAATSPRQNQAKEEAKGACSLQFCSLIIHFHEERPCEQLVQIEISIQFRIGLK